jgi:hypothetical protein
MAESSNKLIVLLNLLIAVVIDSYNTIKDEKTEEVFWSGRLEFVTELEVIKNWFHTHIPSVFCGPSATATESDRWDFVCGYEVEDYVSDDDKIWKLFLAVLADKSKIIMLLCPFIYLCNAIWFIFGAVTAGLFWPPAIRKRLWDRRISKDEDSMKKVFKT